MSSYVPYRWQKEGTQIAIPSAKTHVANVLGFLNPFTNRLISFQLPEKTTMKSEIFIEYIDEFIKKVNRPTVLVLDRASWHTSNLTKSMFKEWEKKGLFIFFLPPRCPHLNLIETLWRKMKYEWFCIADFKSKETLQKKINHILKYYGEEYCIKFSMNIFNQEIIL